MRMHVLLSILLSMALASAALAQGGFTGPGWYQIINVRSAKALSLDRDMSTVTQFPPSNMEFQAWVIEPADPGFFFIRNGLNGNALEPTAGNNSSIVLGAPFQGTPSQQWRLDRSRDGNVLLVNRYGKALDVPGGSVRDGIRIQIYDPNGDPNQRFMLRRLQGEFGGRWRGRGRGEGRGEQRREGATVACASEDGRRRFCNADTRNGVRLLRQIGGDCRLNETWGFDNRGVWVDRGCRAEFQVGGR
jgi:hypothetical protein